MTTAKDNIQLPYFKDTGLDGKKLYTPKECTERSRHSIKRINDMDIKPALSGETIQKRHNNYQASKNTYTGKPTHTRKVIVDSAGNKTGHHYINARQRRLNATSATNWDNLQEYAAAIPRRLKKE